MTKRLFWIVIIFIVFGLVMLSSAGVVEGNKRFGDSYYFARHQLLFGALPGLALMFALSRINYRFWEKTSWLVLIGALALLILVFVPSVGVTLNKARSWIRVFDYTFQPVEFVKLGLIIYLAAWFGGHDDRIKNWTYGLLPFFMVVGFIGVLLALQPDVGGLVVVTAIALGVYFMAGVSLRDFLIMAVVGVVAFGGLILAEPYRLDRIKTLVNPSIDPRGISYQVNQSLIAIGSGGIFGVGFQNSAQKKFGFLPEAVGDSIFAIIGEELGLVGAGATIALFLLLCFTLASIAKRTHDRFAKLYVMGMTTWIMAQAFVNIAAVSGIGPLTGIPLPFISFGGTALVALLAGLGIVFNVAKHAHK